LDREFGNRFGDAKYAMEELVAELGSVMLSIISKVDEDLSDFREAEAALVRIDEGGDET